MALLQLGAAGLPLSVAAGAAADPDSTESFRERGMGAPFDPKQCKTGDRRYVYWAARDQVFRFRFDPTQPVYARAPMDGYGGQTVMGLHEIPPAPNPEEPEGCYGNPLRGGGVPYMRDHAAALFRQLAGRDLRINFGSPWSHGYFALSQRLVAHVPNAMYRVWYPQRPHCIRHPSGISECMYQKDAAQRSFQGGHVLKLPGDLLFAGVGYPVQDLYVSFHADAATYVTAKEGGSPMENGYVIESGFDLYGAVRLLDSFRFYPDEIDLLLPYYRGQIRYLTEAHVPRYPWPAAMGKQQPGEKRND
ncbi:MAG: hypothetical protein ACREMA_05270 [Longimicrobiales bacterium]